MKTHFLEWCTPGYGIHGVVGPTTVVVGSGVRGVARVARVVKVVGVVTVVAMVAVVAVVPRVVGCWRWWRWWRWRGNERTMKRKTRTSK
jgi:membrane-bound ClpP family serine protease